MLADGLCFFLFHVVKYRANVIEDNLTRCFPSLGNAEIRSLRYQFTRHLSDLFLEGLKGFSMDKNELKKRYRVKNPEILEANYKLRQSILFAGSHYNNWEWGVLIYNQWLTHQVSGIYQVVKNPYIHQYLMKRRARWGMNLISARNAIPSIIENEDIHAVMILSDQSPSNMNRAIWTEFLGRKTPCLHGLEVMAKKTNFPVFYYEVKKIKRGFYETSIELLIENPSLEKSEEITKKYMRRLEQTILQEPLHWLWSHRRWKHVNKKSVP